MEQRNAWSQQLHVNNLIQLTATSTDRYFLISVSILSYFTKKKKWIKILKILQIATEKIFSKYHNGNICIASSIQFSHSAVSNSLQPHGLQHAKPHCPSPAPKVYSNSCPLTRWCHPTISSSVIPFSSCPLSLLASGSFQMSHLFESGGHSMGVSASTSVLPMNTQDWYPLGWTG